MFKDFDRIFNEYKKQNIHLSDQWFFHKKVEFIYHSNKLEGNGLSYTDTYNIARDKITIANEVPFTDLLEVKGHQKAVDDCMFMVRNKYPLTEKIVKNMNANLLFALWNYDEYYASWKSNKQELGMYKVINNNIRYTLDEQQGVIEPLSNKETVEKNMEHVFYENKNIPHVLERCAHMAFRLFIHQPFPDGNKRTARLAVAYELMKEGLPLISFKAEGYHFNEGLLRSYKENTLLPLIEVIEMEVKQQVNEIIDTDRQLRIIRT